MASSPNTSRQIDGEKWKEWQILFSCAPDHCRLWLKPWNEKMLAAWKIQRASSLEKTLMLGKTEGRRRRGRPRMSWLNGATDSTDMSSSKLWQTVRDRQAWCAAVHGVTKGWTEPSAWTATWSHVDFLLCFLLKFHNLSLLPILT